MRFLRIAAASTLLLSLAVPSGAADRFEAAHGSKQGVNGTISVWGQYVAPTGGIDDDVACVPGETAEFCLGVSGWGMYAGASAPLHDNWMLIGDFTFDRHAETAQNSFDEEPASYFGVGAHLVHRGDVYDVGAFGVGGIGRAHNDAPPFWVDPVLGGGLEIRRGNWFAQGGYLQHAWERDGEGLDYLVFGRIGSEHQLRRGTLAGSLLLGFADFNNLSAVEAPGEWLQLTLDYRAPISNADAHWYIGYQGDWLHNDAAAGEHQVFFHALKFGMTFDLDHSGQGAADPWAPFTTPNFRAPVSNASELAE